MLVPVALVLRVPVRVVDVVDVSVVRHGGVAAVIVMGVTEVALVREAIGVGGGLILLIHGGIVRERRSRRRSCGPRAANRRLTRDRPIQSAGRWSTSP